MSELTQYSTEQLLTELNGRNREADRKKIIAESVSNSIFGLAELFDTFVRTIYDQTGEAISLKGRLEYEQAFESALRDATQAFWEQFGQDFATRQVSRIFSRRDPSKPNKSGERFNIERAFSLDSKTNEPGSAPALNFFDS